MIFASEMSIYPKNVPWKHNYSYLNNIQCIYFLWYHRYIHKSEIHLKSHYLYQVGVKFYVNWLREWNLGIGPLEIDKKKTENIYKKRLPNKNCTLSILLWTWKYFFLRIFWNVWKNKFRPYFRVLTTLLHGTKR